MDNAEDQILQLAYHSASSRLIMLDYDGTLVDFAQSPLADLAKPSVELRSLFAHLVNDTHNHVVIVSGRPRKVLNDWFEGINLSLIAEHGAWTRLDGHWSKADGDFSLYKAQLMPIVQKYVTNTAGAELEEKEFSLVWHYRNVTPELAAKRYAELSQELADTINDEAIGVFTGHKVIEIKLIAFNKGDAVNEFVKNYESDFIFAAGDDYTDEDMFIKLPSRSFTVKVGDGNTNAQYRLQTVCELISLLKELSNK